MKHWVSCDLFRSFRREKRLSQNHRSRGRGGRGDVNGAASQTFRRDDWFAESLADSRRSANLSPCICDGCFSDDDEAERSFDFWQVSVAFAEPGDVPQVTIREHQSREAVGAALRELSFDPSDCNWVGASEPHSDSMDRMKPSAN